MQLYAKTFTISPCNVILIKFHYDLSHLYPVEFYNNINHQLLCIIHPSIAITNYNHKILIVPLHRVSNECCNGSFVIMI